MVAQSEDELLLCYVLARDTDGASTQETSVSHGKHHCVTQRINRSLESAFEAMFDNNGRANICYKSRLNGLTMSEPISFISGQEPNPDENNHIQPSLCRLHWQLHSLQQFVM